MKRNNYLGKYNENDSNGDSNGYSSENRNNRRNKNENRTNKKHSYSGEKKIIEEFRTFKKGIKKILKETQQKIVKYTNEINKEYDQTYIDKNWNKFKSKIQKDKHGLSESKWDTNTKTKAKKKFQKNANKKIKELENNIKDKKKILDEQQHKLSEEKNRFKEKLKLYRKYDKIKKNNDEIENLYDQIREIEGILGNIQKQREYLKDKLLFKGSEILKSPLQESYSKHKYTHNLQKKLTKKMKKFINKYKN
jgi:hypothetical protein